MVFPEKLREYGGANGFDGSQAQAAGKLGYMGDCILCVFQLLHDRDSVFVEQGSLVGQGGLLADAVKEMDVQLLLQLLNLNGDVKCA